MSTLCEKIEMELKAAAESFGLRLHTCNVEVSAPGVLKATISCETRTVSNLIGIAEAQSSTARLEFEQALIRHAHPDTGEEWALRELES